jgi:hypothetical protein
MPARAGEGGSPGSARAARPVRGGMTCLPRRDLPPGSETCLPRSDLPTAQRPAYRAATCLPRRSRSAAPWHIRGAVALSLCRRGATVAPPRSIAPQVLPPYELVPRLRRSFRRTLAKAPFLRSLARPAPKPRVPVLFCWAGRCDPQTSAMLLRPLRPLRLLLPLRPRHRPGWRGRNGRGNPCSACLPRARGGLTFFLDKSGKGDKM